MGNYEINGEGEDSDVLNVDSHRYSFCYKLNCLYVSMLL